MVLAAASALGGCSSDGSKAKGSPAPGASATGPSGTPTGSAAPSPGQSAGDGRSPGTGTTTGPAPKPAPSASPSAPDAPAPSASGPASAQTLVAVTRSGGITGKTSTLVIKGDGSFLRLDAKAVTTDRGKLSATALAKLRTALREADFPRLPRISMPDKPVMDGFTYAFRHGGYEVAAAQTAVPESLEDVLSALPPFEPR